jgi:Fe(3+) dicitrate transport protein
MSVLKFTASLAVLAAVIGSSGPALAEDAVLAGATADPVLLEGVIITGSEAQARDVAGSATFLDAEALATFSYTDVNRILRQVPGVTLQEEDGFGLRPNIGIRGSGSDRASRIAVMEDGVLIAPAPYAAPSAYYFPRMGRMSGVEVVKGPAAIKYGPLTTGGALQFFSTPIPEAEGRIGGRGELLGGSYGGVRSHGVLGGWAEPAGPVQVGGLVEGLFERSDGFKDLDSGGDTGFEISDVVVKLGLRSGPDAAMPQTFELKYQRYDETSDETYTGLTLADFRARPYRRYRGSQADVMDVEHTTWQATHRIELTPWLDVTTLAYRTETARAWYKLNDVLSGGSLRSVSAVLADPVTYAEGYATLVGAPGFTSAANALRVRNNNRTYYAQGVQSVATLRFDTGGLTHKLELSARIHRDEEDRLQEDDRYQMADGRMVLTTAGARGSQENRVGEATAKAFFVQDTIQAGRLTLSLGVRYETIDLTRTRYVLGDPSRGTVLGVNRSEVDVWIPGVGATFELTPDVLLVAGAHKGFSNPAPGSTTDPETSWNYEAGLRFSRGDARLEAIAFFTDYQNLVGTCTASTGGGCSIGAQFDGGAVEVKGLELTAAQDLAGLLDLPFAAPVSLVYTFTEAEFKSSFVSGYGPWGTVTTGFELPYLPRDQLTLNAGAHGDRWRVDASMNLVSETRSVAGAGPIPANRLIESRTLVDLSGEYDLSPGLGLFVQIQNVTDEVYNVAFSPAGARPGAPRMVMGGLRLKF